MAGPEIRYGNSPCPSNDLDVTLAIPSETTYQVPVFAWCAIWEEQAVLVLVETVTWLSFLAYGPKNSLYGMRKHTW